MNLSHTAGVSRDQLDQLRHDLRASLSDKLFTRLHNMEEVYSHFTVLSAYREYRALRFMDGKISWVGGCKTACNMIDLSIYRQNYQMIWIYLECCRWSFYVGVILAIAEQTL